MGFCGQPAIRLKLLVVLVFVLLVETNGKDLGNKGWVVQELRQNLNFRKLHFATFNTSTNATAAE